MKALNLTIALAIGFVLGIAHQLDGPDEVQAAHASAAEAAAAPQQVASATSAERTAQLANTSTPR